MPLKKKYILVIAVDMAAFLLFVLTSFFQWQLFAQNSGSQLIIHLTRTEWGFSSLTIQNFSYNYSNGTTTATSGLITYLNYPYIIAYFFLIENIVLVVNLLRNKEAKTDKRTMKT